MLKIIPLGGLGEIGLNMMVFEYKDTIILIDTGLMFPEDYMLGIDIVIPDIAYLKQTKSSVSGIILTHAHEDHIGALPYLLREINAPVFGTAFTLGIVKHKLEEHGLLETATLHEIGPKEMLNIGPFNINFLRVGHSVVDGVGLAIRTPVGLIVHTGDFKISYDSSSGMITDVSGFAQYGDKGVLALLSDSTNVEKEGHTISGKQVGESLRNILSKSSGRIIVALFASNVARIQKIVDIAKERGCKIVFNGRSVELTVQIAKKLNYLNVMDNMEITVDRINDFPDDKIIIVTTGSQGEPMSALARIAAGTHKQVKIKDNDTVILSSKFIPGNEKAIAHIINNLYRQGADVIYEKISDIHVSGHAFREELKLMINLTRPKYFIPIHGEYRHLVLHSRLAQSMGIKKERVLLAEDGQIIEFDKKGGRIGDSVETGRVLVDGKGVGDVGRSVLKERRNLSEDGIVVVAMAIHEKTGALVHGPEIISKGFVFFSEAGHILDDAQSIVLDIVQKVGVDEPDRIEVIKSRIQTALRKYFNFTIKRRPIILPVIIEV